jgi:hypothetical protein
MYPSDQSQKSSKPEPLNLTYETVSLRTGSIYSKDINRRQRKIKEFSEVLGIVQRSPGLVRSQAEVCIKISCLTALTSMLTNTTHSASNQTETYFTLLPSNYLEPHIFIAGE